MCRIPVLHSSRSGRLSVIDRTGRLPAIVPADAGGCKGRTRQKYDLQVLDLTILGKSLRKRGDQITDSRRLESWGSCLHKKYVPIMQRHKLYAVVS